MTGVQTCALPIYLDSLTRSGSLCLFVPLLPSFREGPSHRYYPWLIEALHSLASAAVVQNSTYAQHQQVQQSQQVQQTQEQQSQQSQQLQSQLCSVSTRLLAVQAVCGYCLSVATDESEDMSVKFTLFDSLCVPVLSGCDPNVLLPFFTDSWCSLKVLHTISGVSTGGSVIKVLYDITQRELQSLTTTTTTTDNDNSELETLKFLQSCSYKLIEIMYDRCPLSVLKNEISKSFFGPNAKGNELTGSVSKSAYKLVRTLLPGTYTENDKNNENNDNNENNESNVSSRLYSSAFNCLGITVAKTQNEEKFYDMFLFKQKPGECVWARLVDCKRQYKFYTETENFKTVYIGSGTAERMSNVHASKRTDRIGRMNVEIGRAHV